MKPIESWKNSEFLASPDARILRIISEYLEPAARFRKHNVHGTIMIWGSARIKSPTEAKKLLETAKKTKDADKIHNAEKMLELSHYYADAEKLAQMLTEWSMKLENGKEFLIATGGGAVGIMEAANKGAANVKGRSIGLGVTLPFEEKLNDYIPPELQIQFHYFFMRKFWMVYLARALVAFPGGFGTMDELFEVLTLIQTGKPRKKMPVILYGSKYWNSVVNIDAMIDWGTVSPKDKELYHICDTPEHAFEILTKKLTEMYLQD